MKHLLTALLLLLAAIWPNLVAAQSAARSSTDVLWAANGTPYFVRLPATGPATRAQAADHRTLLREQLALGPHDELRPLRQETDALGQRHEVFQQYYQGIKVEHGRYTVHSRAGRAELLTGEIKRVPALRLTPALPEAAALARAQAAVGARSYRWQDAAAERQLRARTGNPRATYRPRGQLVLVEDFRQPAATRPVVLAWKFDLYAQQPLSRTDVYVNARTGDVALANATLTAVTGTAFSGYSGQLSIETERLTGPVRYRLGETGRTRNGQTGAGMQTYNAARTNSFALTDFLDNDNYWSPAEFANAAKDYVAFDAHWGAEMTFDYWADVHGRSSYDNQGSPLVSFVHFDDTPGDGIGMSNAYWDGAEMLYGDGSSRPFTTLDVCGHEIGHAVCQATAALLYRDEAGALNEGFSDIWGACIERYAGQRFPLPGKSTWLMGEQLSSGGIRSMSNPNDHGDPDTYGGTYWRTSPTDYGGVHANSGVLNFWFYLLNEGGSGTNDLGFAYNVTGISPSSTAATINQAALIAFRAESLYLTSNATFAQARTATVQAATDLYGAGSPQVTQVGNAWDAVGVRDASVALRLAAFSPAQATSSSGALVTLTGTNLTGATGVRFNGTAAPGFTVVSSTTLTVPLPPGASTGKIVVTTPSASASSLTDFVVVVGPLVSGVSPASGPVGQVLTITGQNFAAPVSVTVGGVPATNVGLISATQLTAIVGQDTPAGAQPVVVTTAPGSSNATVAYTVVVPPPTLTSFTPATGPPVGGGSLLVSGSNFVSSPLNVTVAGLPAPNVTVVSPTQLRVTVPAGAAGTTGPVRVSTPGGTATSATAYAYLDALSVAYFAPTAAPAGSTVTAYGAQLATVSDLTVNGTPATILGRTGSSLTFRVPAGAPATGLSTVTSPAGTATNPDFQVQLRLLGSSPAPNGRNAPRTNSPVDLTFSEPVTAASAAGIRVVSARLGGTKAGTWAGLGTAALRFAAVAGTPRSDFSPGEKVSVTLPGTVASAGGLALPRQVYQFTAATGGTGQGSLTQHQVLTTSGYGATAELGDVDGDGDLDIVTVGVNNAEVRLFLNGGDNSGSNTGTFAPGAQFYSYQCEDLALGDVDNDGDLDLLVVSFYTGQVSVYRNAGLHSGNFALYSTVAVGQYPISLGVGDLDGDGDLDLVTAARDINQLSIRLNGGDNTGSASGQFAGGSDVSVFTTPGTTAGYVTTGDVDGDGDLDLLAGGSNNANFSFQVAILLNGGDRSGSNTATFPAPAYFVTTNAANAHVLLGDVDGDGDPDLVAHGLTGRTVSVRLNGGDASGSYTGQFSGGSNLALPAGSGVYWGAQFGDVDADGDLDLVIPSYLDASVILSRNDGTGTFTVAAQYQLPPATKVYYTDLGDLDGDGDLDVLVTDLNQAPMYVLFNGPFAPLPVKLVTFTATASGPAAVRLTWTTASEVNSAAFEVQRSSDGSAWQELGQVAATGSSAIHHTYAYLDAAAPAGTSYYRLRQVDTDGTAAYSPVRAVVLGGGGLALFPNPAPGAATLIGAMPSQAVQVLDALGRVAATATVGPDGTAALGGLAPGLYVVRVGAGSVRLAVE